MDKKIVCQTRLKIIKSGQYIYILKILIFKFNIKSKNQKVNPTPLDVIQLYSINIYKHLYINIYTKHIYKT